MQRLLFQQAEVTQFRSQAIRVLPGHGTGIEGEAINDDVYHDETSMLRLVFSVLGNVIVGTLLLSTLFVLPHIVAGILS
mgnify:CR=1 FL=1